MRSENSDRNEVISHDFKKQQQSTTRFSFVDDCCSLFNCCGGRKVKVLTDQRRVDSMKGKEPERESIDASSSTVRIDPPVSSPQISA